MKIHSTLRTLAICLCLGFSAVLNGQGFILTLDFALYDAPPGEEVVLDVLASNNESIDFSGITSLSGSFHYESDQFAFVGTENYLLEGMSENDFTNTPENILTLVWNHPMPFGITPVDAGDVLFSIRFQRLADGIPDFYIDNNPEFASAAFDGDIAGDVISGDFYYADTAGSLITGSIFHDANDNCTNDNEVSLAQQRLVVTSEGSEFEVFTNAQGEFEFYLFEGSFELSVLPFSEIWEPCPPLDLEVVSGEDYSVDMGLRAVVDCESMSVDIATGGLIRCFDGSYEVEYCNIGTQSVSNPLISVNLDEFLSFQSGTINPTTQDGNTLTFEPGPVEVGDCGNFSFIVEVGCDDAGVVLGQTHCTSAEITPYDTCVDPDPLWDGSSLEVTGSCDGEEVIFLIKNNGADMQQAAEFIVIEDELIMNQEPINLSAGGEVSVPFEAVGTTYRAEVQQSPGHPGMSMPSFAVEGCGTNDQGEISLGYVTMFPEDDANPNISIFCIENVGAYDPNDKQGFPRGATEERFIEPNTDIEYMIRFQNTGTAPAVNVVIRDTLSNTLDPLSLRQGVSSHPYVLEIYDENQLVFKFDNIMLPDSASNLAESQGFVTFRISQTEDLPDNTLIENDAAIYFDFNAPIFTNTTLHKVGRDFLEVILDTASPLQSFDLQVAPNPLTQTAVFKLEGLSGEHTFTLYDLQGKVVREERFAGEEYRFDRKSLAAGMYLFEIAGRSGKLILKN